MKYKKAEEKLKTARKALTAAKRAYVLATDAYAKGRQNIETVKSALTDAMARQVAGQASSKDVTEARRAYEKACKQIDDLKIELEAAEKLIPIREKELAEVKAEFIPIAEEHFKKECRPKLEAYVAAIEAIENITNDFDELKKTLASFDLQPGDFLPLPIKRLTIEHMKHNYTFNDYKSEINQLL